MDTKKETKKVQLTFKRVDADTGNLIYKGDDGNIYIEVEGQIHDVTRAGEPLTPVHNVEIKKGEPVYNPADRFARNVGSKVQMVRGGKVENGDRVRVPKDLTSDPYQRQGEIGVIQKVEKEVATVKFSKKHKGKYIGKYKIDSLQPIKISIPSKEEDSQYARGGKLKPPTLIKSRTAPIPLKEVPIKDLVTDNIKNFFPPDELKVVLHNIRSAEEEEGFFREVLVTFDKLIAAMPSTYETDGIALKDKIAALHYFSSGSDWYIIEKDKGSADDASEDKGKQFQALGYAILNGDMLNAEAGFVSIEELKSNPQVQLDLYFRPTKIGEIIAERNKKHESENSEVFELRPKKLRTQEENIVFYKTNTPVTKVTILWAEGLHAYAEQYPKDFPDFISASEYIRDNIPELTKMGYDKHGVDAEWKDGETWGRERVDISVKENNPFEFDNIFGAFVLDVAFWYMALAGRGIQEYAERAQGYGNFITERDWQITVHDFKKVFKEFMPRLHATGDLMKNYGNKGFKPYTEQEFLQVLNKYLAPLMDAFFLYDQGASRIKSRQQGNIAELPVKDFLKEHIIVATIPKVPVLTTAAAKAADNAVNPLAQEQIQNPMLESLHYEPESDACLTLDTNVPAAMRFEIKQALANIDRRVNGVDEFVAQKLHYVKNKCTPDEYKEGLKCLCDAFAAEQVDAIAVAIYNIESKGYATINADMTGIGKGRVAAGLIRYGLMNEITPVFFTERPSLFSDIYRDLIDIGSDSGIPLFRLEAEKREKTIRATKKEIIEKIQDDIANGEYAEDFDADTLFNPENKKHLDGVIEVYAEKYFPSSTVLIESYKENLSYAHDIKGKSLVKPFIINGYGDKTDVKDGNGNILYRGLPRKQTSDILKTQTMPSDSQVVLCTYSQIASSHALAKRDFIKALAPRSIFIFDESHNAAGDSNTGTYLLSIVSEAKAVSFFSATYAKRPDNMPIYAVKTSMGDANMSQEKLVDAIKSGGVALQEVVTALLASEGQLIRRERSFEGITVDYVNLDETQNEINPALNLAAEHRALFDMATDLLRETIRFQSIYVEHELDQLDQEVKAAQKEVTLTAGTQAAGISNPPEFSGVFNIVNQILFSIKAKAVAEIAIQQLKEGKKPITAFASTMESFLDSFIKPDGLPLKEGDVIVTDFTQVFLKRLQGVMRYTVTDSEGNREQKVLNPQEIGGQFEAEYNRIADKIRKATTSINISPIDVVLDMISKAGYSVQEITGRQRVLKLIDDKTAQVAVRTRLPNNDLVRGYNNNEIDNLLLNQAGSTGMSAHATHRGTKLKREEVKPRVMIVLQPELNINTEVQKRGRINRSGQLSDSKDLTAEQRQHYKPSYIYVTSAVPAEQRLNMMLQRKLKSLDANTTSNQKQSRKIMDMPDFLNKYGDDLVYDYLVANPVINETLGDPLNITDSLAKGQEVSKSKPDAAYKVAGRVAILPTKDQEDFYVKMGEDYEALVEYLKETGEYDLEVEALNLQAETLSRDVAVVGTGNGSVFSRNTILEKCEVNVLKKPYKAAELQSMIAAALQDGQGGQYDPKQLSQLLLDEMNDFTNEMMKRELEESKKHHENLRNTIVTEKGYKKLELKSKNTDAYVLERNQEINDGELAAQIRIERTWKQKQSYLQPLLKEFTIGKVVAYPTIDYGSDENTEWNYGIFLGFDIRRNTKNPWTPASMKAKFALASSQKAIAVPLSKVNILNTVRILTHDKIGSFMSTAHLLEDWDKKIKEATRNRTVRYIVTGNILQAFGHDQLKGKLISYTTSSGTEKKGILLPESFSMDNTAEGHEPFRVKVPIIKAAPLIKSLIPESSIITDNGVSIFKYDDKTYNIIVSASRERGGRFYLNPAILSLLPTGNFDKVSGNMVGKMPSRNIEKLLQILQQSRSNVDLNSTQFDLIKDTIDIEVYTDEEKFVARSAVVLEKLSAEDTAYEQELKQQKVQAQQNENYMRMQYKIMKLIMMLK